MKLVAVVSLFVAVLSFGTSVAAQCADLASCEGQQAEASARVREYQRATAAVIATDRAIQRAATAETRAILATESAMGVTATELARPTRPLAPTATSLPTVTPVPSVTPQPTATSPNLNATAMSIVVNAIQPSRSTPVALSEEESARRQTIGNAVIAGLLLMIAGGIYFFYRVITAKHEIDL